MASLTLAQAFDGAVSAYRAGKLVEAETLCQQIVAAKADFFDAQHLLAVVQAALGRPQAALASYDRALALRPEFPDALNNRGNVLRDLGRPAEALASYDRALAGRPDFVEAHSHRGNALRDLGRSEEALGSYERAILLRPDYAEAHNNRGNALADLKRHDEALAGFERAIGLRADYAEAHYNRANALRELGRHDQALAAYERALVLRPAFVEALSGRGAALKALLRYDEALTAYDQALALRPAFPEALNNRGLVLQAMARSDAALASYDRALSLRPDYADALYNRGNVLSTMKRYDEARASYERALAADEGHPHAFSADADCAIRTCDWSQGGRPWFADRMAEHVESGKAIVSPFVLLGYSDDPALQLRCARRFIANLVPVAPPPMWQATAYRHERIRIAYLSADFHQHATAHLAAGLFERHDRRQFEVIGVSYGPDDGSAMRARVIAGFDAFHDVAGFSDEAAARLLRDLEVDIAIDLKGYTQDARMQILSHRPAPVQVSYLGFPGTMGADFIDYVIADATTLPFDRQPDFSEQIVHLPNSYQVNDDRRANVGPAPTRAQAELPQSGFVFCCFNNSWKIAPDTFEVWMRLLARTPGSVLWLLRDNASAEQNLRAQAQRRGIDPARLVFAEPAPIDEHLARHRLADLFLDTLPYNAHTTASDALWTGLPVVTCAGEAFAGRVAASLLSAAGLGELVAADLAAYEALALRLAGDPVLLASLKARLEDHRRTCALFDTGRFTRHIEAAYRTMWETQQAGGAPGPFAVAVD